MEPTITRAMTPQVRSLRRQAANDQEGKIDENLGAHYQEGQGAYDQEGQGDHDQEAHYQEGQIAGIQGAHYQEGQ